MKRTLIEFYDEDHLENVFGLFAAKYDRVLFLCQKEPPPVEKARLNRFIESRFGFRPEYKVLADRTVEAVQEHIRACAAEGQCHIDITGGPCFCAAAAGISAAEDPSIAIVQYDVKAGRRVFCYPTCINGAPAPAACLAVDEMILLGGGGLQPLNRQSSPPLTDTLRKEVFRLWEAVRHDIRGWNNFHSITPLSEAEPGQLGRRVPYNKEERYRRTLKKLEAAGIVTDVHTRRRDNQVESRFRLNVPAEARILYEKAGNLLELVARVAAEDSGMFCDCMTGAMLDWSVLPPWGTADPANEVDLVLTRGHIPVFVSCKGTELEKDYLYEISTLARHYGGIYAKAAVFSTENNDRPIRQRAKEMGILVIDRISDIGIEGLTARLRRDFEHI